VRNVTIKKQIQEGKEVGEVTTTLYKTAALPAQVLRAIDDMSGTEVCTSQFIHHERLPTSTTDMSINNTKNTGVNSRGR